MEDAPRRELFIDGDHALRATWHDERACIVLSIWRDGACAATFDLSADEADRLASFFRTFASPAPAPA